MKHQLATSRRRGFTLIELLVVIAIIGILAGFLLPALARAQWSARKAKCISQLKQFDVAIETYRNSYEGQPPIWLSNLYPTVVSNLKLYICPEDPMKGKDGGKPWYEKNTANAFFETDDFAGSTADTLDPQAAAVQNDNVTANSYLYEFCGALCIWGGSGYTWGGKTCDFASNYRYDPEVHGETPPGQPNRGLLTWREIKEWEVDVIGDWTPIVRCFWHSGGTFLKQDIVLNLGSKTHHVYMSGTGADDWKTAGNR